MILGPRRKILSGVPNFPPTYSIIHINTIFVSMVLLGALASPGQIAPFALPPLLGGPDNTRTILFKTLKLKLPY